MYDYEIYSSDEDQVVKYCRSVFKENYRNYWIDTKNLEEDEVSNDLKSVLVD